MACLFCASTTLEPLYEGIRDRYGVAEETHRFLRCRDCGSAMLDPLPSPEQLVALYSSDYTFKPEPARSALRRFLQAVEWRCFYEPGYLQRLALMRRLTGLHRGLVLEVGCGSGLFLRYLRDAGYAVEGVETSESRRERTPGSSLGLDRLRGRARGRCRSSAGHYDAVVMVYVLEHIPDPAATLARIHALLKPGGWVVLGLPVIDSGQSRWLGARWSAVTEAPRHVAIPVGRGRPAPARGRGIRGHSLGAVAARRERRPHRALSSARRGVTPGPTARRAAPRFSRDGRRERSSCCPSLLLAAVERLPVGPTPGRAPCSSADDEPGGAHVS